MTTLDDARLEQREAIEASGWGAPFRLVQLRNACFWVFALAMVLGTFRMLQFYGAAEAYAVGIGSGVALLLVYAVPWLLLLTHHNRYTSLPASVLLFCFVWGFVPATYWLGLAANTQLLGIYNKVFGHAWTLDFGGGLAAPFTEETAKSLAVVLVIGLAPHLVRSAYDGLILGAFAGLGLQVSEDLLYVYNTTQADFGADQVGSALTVVLQRGGAGLVQHVLFSAVFCAGLVWLLGRDGGKHRLRGALFMVAAMVVHSCWDNLTAYGTAIGGPVGAGLFLPTLVVVELLLLWQVFRLAAPQEREWVRSILAPEVERGVLSEAEVTAIVGTRRDRTGAREPGEGRRAAAHVRDAGLDLAHALAVSRGEEDDEVRHARAEVERLRGGPLQRVTPG
ncbi:PrsW family intramembrane metalloprotease [Nocardioides euryhalodurans]|uniref:PrsW family intramembrane metalloprotease n=1 Tax=Nocardioides euryhalodurans TaxID=2518370 RepID=A0A4P7GKA1_9ACTN|nr:PrsW family glutamic-type intramembrane protease [Nocardioides euryhalodurans]QBR92470.1 PrsW family intramembrane metalloprotease [Nocardioides euryhalodurans]